MSQSNSQETSKIDAKDITHPQLVKRPTITYDRKTDNLLKNPGQLKSPKPLRMQVSYNTDVSYDIKNKLNRPRNLTVQQNSSGLMRFDSSESENMNAIKFPKFIPDDPEKPHLSSTAREKARRLIIREYIKYVLEKQQKEYQHKQLSPLANTVFNDEKNTNMTYW